MVGEGVGDVGAELGFPVGATVVVGGAVVVWADFVGADVGLDVVVVGADVVGLAVGDELGLADGDGVGSSVVWVFRKSMSCWAAALDWERSLRDPKVTPVARHHSIGSIESTPMAIAEHSEWISCSNSSDGKQEATELCVKGFSRVMAKPRRPSYITGRRTTRATHEKMSGQLAG